MPNEFKELMRAFAAIAPVYCDNMKQITEDMEMRKVVDIYKAGLTAAMSKTAELISSHFEELSPTQQQEIDRHVGASGGYEMLQAASATMQENFLGNFSALINISKIIELIKKIITNFVSLPGGLGKLLRKIDLIIDLINGAEPKEKGPGKEVPPGETQPGVDDTEQMRRRARIRAWIDAIMDLSDPKAARQAGLLREILRKGEITDADYEQANKIYAKVMGR